jgi:glutamate N-acetyltransferase / amino-acid N-acetyltransferase
MSAARITRATPLLRTYSTTTKKTPSKDHLHVPIPDAHFPSGYLLTGLHAGIKKKPGVLDLGVLTSTTPRTSSAACFTRNVFKAAPVQVSTEVLRLTGGRARNVVVNSGCANAVTGRQGMKDAWAMARATDAIAASSSTASSSINHNDDGATSETLVLSTGVIGQPLPIQKILSGIASPSTVSSLASSFDAWQSLAKAFMTTDTFPKLRAREFTLNGHIVRIAGVDKGAGMIHPNMGPPPGPPHATLLGLVATDAAISPRSLQTALTYAVERSFNSISVDGDMSTNDTIIALANGASGMEKEIDEEHDKEGYTVFRDELTSFATELAQLVVRDGEGATKFVTISVEVRLFLLASLPFSW